MRRSILSLKTIWPVRPIGSLQGRGIWRRHRKETKPILVACEQNGRHCPIIVHTKPVDYADVALSFHTRCSFAGGVEGKSRLRLAMTPSSAAIQPDRHDVFEFFRF